MSIEKSLVDFLECVFERSRLVRAIWGQEEGDGRLLSGYGLEEGWCGLIFSKNFISLLSFVLHQIKATNGHTRSNTNTLFSMAEGV